MADFFDEIKDDLKREKFEKLISKYGIHFAVMVAVVILATASITWYSGHLSSTQAKTGDKFFEAVGLLPSDSGKAQEVFADIYKNGNGEASVLAGIRQGELMAGKSPVQAVKLLDEIASDSYTDRQLRDLASLHAVAIMMENERDFKQLNIDTRLENLVKSGGAWQASAHELEAYRAIKNGDNKKAVAIFSALRDDPLAPIALKKRAEKMMKIIDKS